MGEVTQTKIHFSWILYYIFNISVKCVIYAFAFNVLQRIFHFTDIMKYIFIILIGLVLIIKQGLYWYNFSLKFNSNVLTIREGGMFVRERRIQFNDIEGYNEKANVLEKIFGLSSLILKVEKNTNEKNIILPYIKNDYINIIKSNITVEKDKLVNNQNKYYYKVSFKQILKGSMTSLNILVFFTFFYTIYENVNSIFNFDNEINIVKKLYLTNLTSIFIGTTLVLLLIILFGIFKNFIQFGDFKLTDNKNFIYTNWGIFLHYDNAIDKRQISAIHIQSTFWQRFFKIHKISVINLNSKNENLETNILIPFIEKNKINEILNTLFKVKLDNFIYYKLTKFSVFTKLIRTSWSWLIVLPVCLYFFRDYWLIFIFLILLVLFSQIFQVFFNKYYYTNKLLIYQHSGISTSEYIINFDNIEDVVITQNFIQKLFKVCSTSIVIKDSPPKKIKMHDIYEKHAYNIAMNFQYHNE